MAKRSADALQKQKEARQKKILLALLPVLLLLLVWQGPGMLKAFSGGTPPPEAAPAPATPPAPATAAPEAPGAPSTAAPAAAPGTAAPGTAAPGVLPDTDDPLTPESGQLVSFDRFVGKDPFRQQVVARDPASAGDDDPAARGGSDDDASGGGSGGGSDDPAITDPGGGGGGSDGGSGGGSDDDVRTSATVDVNGTREEVFVGTTFPAIDPVFRIVTLRARRASIELVTGEFSNGAKTLTLRLKKPLTLVSQPDGLRYRITLLATGTNSG